VSGSVDMAVGLEVPKIHRKTTQQVVQALGCTT
jgi:hypothetical protein